MTWKPVKSTNAEKLMPEFAPFCSNKLSLLLVDLRFSELFSVPCEFQWDLKNPNISFFEHNQCHYSYVKKPL